MITPSEQVPAVHGRQGLLAHEYVSDQCTHREHTSCDMLCEYCEARCLCVCHRWAIPVAGSDD